MSSPPLTVSVSPVTNVASRRYTTVSATEALAGREFGCVAASPGDGYESQIGPWPAAVG